MLQYLDNLWPWPVILIAIAAAILVWWLRSFLKAAVRQPEDLPLEELPDEVKTLDFAKPRRLGASFGWALKLIERHGGGAKARYQVPWFLLFGEEGSRPADLMARVDLESAFEVPPDGGLAESSGLSWSFFDYGVVLDLGGEYLLRADGESSDLRGWKAFLSKLRRHRPERPLEGLILTLSCAELMRGPAGVEKKAAQLSMRLRELGNELAINVPIYVLITSCEQLPEFASFVEASRRSCSDIFGWSNPYRTDAAFRDVWVDEAYDQLAADLQLAQVEILGQSKPEASLADDVALLPVALDATRETLRSYLSGLFRSSAFQRGSIMRGIYFCGSRRPAASESPDEVVVEPEICYVRDLLTQKVFPEFGLAQPESSAWMGRSRWTRAWQFAAITVALVWSVGLWQGQKKLSRRAADFTPFFKEIARDLTNQETRANTDPEVRANAQYLLAGMVRLDFSRFGSWFMPTSWPGIDPIFERFNRTLEGALVRSYDEIIFKAMHSELGDRARGLSDPKSVLTLPDGDLPSPPPVPPPEGLMSFRAWHQQVGDLVELQKNAARYSQLDSSQNAAASRGSSVRGAVDLEAFGALIEYLFGFRPPKGFFVDSTLYERALDRVTLKPFRTEDYRDGSSKAVLTLADRFRYELFKHNPLIVSLEALAKDLADAVGATATSPEENVRTWKRLLKRLDEIDFILGQPEILWAFGSAPDLGTSYQKLLDGLSIIGFLDSGIADRIVNEVDRDWRLHQERLLTLESRYTGPFLARQDALPQPRLSDQSAQLRDALRLLLGQSFISEENEQWFRLSIPPGTRLDWDTERLAQANALKDPYESFSSAGLDLFPVDMRPQVSRMMRNQTAARMIDLVRRAQTFEPFQVPETLSDRERLLRFQVASLEGAGDPLNRLLSNLEELNAFEAYWDLSALLVLQGDRALTRLDRIASDLRLYQAYEGGFDWWQGESPVSYPAFGVRDRAGLATYLSRQRTRLDQLAAQYASPTISAVGLSRIDESSSYRLRAEKWRAIIEQLGAYQNQTPGNSVAVLENLIALDMTSVSPDDCRAKNLQVADVDNFFLKAADGLSSELLKRCENLAGEQAAARYGELQRLFLQSLGQRFPFAELGASAYPEVDPNDLRAFFALYDAYAPSIRAVPPSNENFEGTGATAQAFLKRLGEVREFFAFFLATPEPQAVPRFDFDVIFRVDRDAEQGGNQIFDWRLQSGEKRIAAPNGSGRWTYGTDAVSLELRWAQDSPRVPFLAEPARHILVRDRIVTYRYDNPWSLLRFVLELRGPSPEPNPQTLTFRIDTQPGARTAEQAPVDPELSESPTVVFLRLRLKTPDAKNPQPVVLPPCFPIYAPELGIEPTPDGCVAQAVAAAQAAPAPAETDEGAMATGADQPSDSPGPTQDAPEKEVEGDL